MSKCNFGGRKCVGEAGTSFFFSHFVFCLLCVCVSECVCISLMDIRKIQVSYPAVLYQPTSYQLCVNQSPQKKTTLDLLTIMATVKNNNNNNHLINLLNWYEIMMTYKV